MSKDRIRVLAIMESLWVTGPAKNLIAFARRLRQADSAGPAIELSVATFDRPSAPAGRFVAALKAADIPAYVIPEKRVADPGVVPKLLAVIRAAQPDIIQTHNTKSHFLMRLTRLSGRIPWIAFFHGFTNTDAKDRFYNRLALWAMRGAPQVVTVCRAFAADLERAGIPKSKIVVRHNIVAPFAPPPREEVDALRGRLGIPGNCRVVLTVGRLSKEKGHEDLIEALALLERMRDCSLTRSVIVGDGPERAPLERLAAERGVSGRVLFTGHRDSVQAFYALADVFALPSHSEGSPNALLEAMAAGLPIVTTNAGGSVELVDDGSTALVVERRSPAELSRAVARLLDAPEAARAMGAAAQAASRNYTPDAYAAALAEVYRTALKRPGKREIDRSPAGSAKTM